MEDDPLMRMYEAQAIVEEKQLEINKLEAEKGELERKIRQLELEKSTVADKLDGVWTVIKKLQKETRESGHNLEEKIIFDLIERIPESISQHMKLKTILIMGGGDENNRACRTMTVLSTDRSDWIKLQLELPYSVFGSGAVFLHNELYVVGGQHNPEALYKLDKNLKWKRLADLNVGRSYITNSCLEVNGYIWVFGGMDGDDNYPKSVERYDPKEDKWTLMPEMSTGRHSAAAVFWKDRIIVCGGWIEKGRITSSAECFLLETGEWSQFPPLPHNLGAHSLVSFENKLILIGGVHNGCRKSVREMDPLQPNDGWKSLPPMKYSRDSFSGLVLDQEIYAIGGRRDENTVLDRVEIFDGKSWRDGPSLPYQRRGHSAVVIPQSLADRLCH